MCAYITYTCILREPQTLYASENDRELLILLLVPSECQDGRCGLCGQELIPASVCQQNYIPNQKDILVFEGKSCAAQARFILDCKGKSRLYYKLYEWT